MSDLPGTIWGMFDTSPQQPSPDSIGPAEPADAAETADAVVPEDDLHDPIASLVAYEISRRFIRLCLSWAEPMTADLANREAMLREAGGAELAERMLAQRLYQRIDPEVLRLLRVAVALASAEWAYMRIEDSLRTRFGEVVRTAISFLLSNDRDVAIQMLAVATTRAGRQVAEDVAAVIAETREGV